MDGLAKAGVEVDRKILSDLAVKEPDVVRGAGRARSDRRRRTGDGLSRRGSPQSRSPLSPRERIGVRESTRAMNGSRASDSGFGTDAGRREFARGPVGAGEAANLDALERIRIGELGKKGRITG